MKINVDCKNNKYYMNSEIVNKNLQMENILCVYKIKSNYKEFCY